jgi:hypothetical protein
MSRQALRLVRSKSMLDKLKKLRIFTECGPLIALAIATGMVLGIVGPSSAQFFNLGGVQQRPQPQRGGRVCTDNLNAGVAVMKSGQDGA